MAKKKYADDDGRVIAPMNVEGMPWYRERPPEVPPREQKEQLTRAQTARVIWNATLAGIVVALAFSAGLVGLVLFLLWIWH
jgi:hypothetical protein